MRYLQLRLTAASLGLSDSPASSQGLVAPSSTNLSITAACHVQWRACQPAWGTNTAHVRFPLIYPCDRGPQMQAFCRNIPHQPKQRGNHASLVLVLPCTRLSMPPAHLCCCTSTAMRLLIAAAAESMSPSTSAYTSPNRRSASR
ncbi:hypothetical protein PLICRDRAFT_251070 [Plicaturopsis crispa FD-325 SS-3]|nr:hypothetical protein PLICRDRAFT_251070 [Plicaturopsis crispa FD-325 SS-3]